MTAVPSSAGTLTRSEMRLSPVLHSSSGFSARVTGGINGAYPRSAEAGSLGTAFRLPRRGGPDEAELAVAAAVSPQAVASPAQVRAILAEGGSAPARS